MKFRLLYKFLLAQILVTTYTTGVGQTVCPPNMGFENGTFQNWQCFSGTVSQVGVVSVSATQPVGSVHTINSVAASATAVDPYGNFPINCPNGSGYSIRLGNDVNGAQAERVSYTFTIPANQNDYSIIYNYAVVFQNPNHQSYQQPRFTSQVFDVTAGQYISCGSFEFVASSGLAGFQLSSMGQNVFYKPWSPITINLNGFAGKIIRLEFTNNDCTLGGHFGYAYLDVNENCSSPISGNIICGSPDSVRLKAPFGFQQYFWYNSNFTQLLGTSNTLLITPAPAANTTYALQIIPYPNLGCEDTVYSTIEVSPDPFVFKVAGTIEACAYSTVDLTAPSVTQGSMPGLKFTYFEDVGETTYITNPKAIAKSGTYYIKAVGTTGCSDILGVQVIFRDTSNLVINDPPQACYPGKVNLTGSSITAGSESNLTYTYWQDAATTVPLQNANAVSASGTYYIKSTNRIGCTTIKPVHVFIADVAVHNPTACGQVDLTAASVTAGSTAQLAYSYWKDASATVALPSPEQVTASGDYYIKGTTPTGCNVVKPVQVKINPYPSLVVKDPPAVVFPATVSLLTAFSSTPTVNYSYWKNGLASSILTQPATVGIPGTYYIKAATQEGCAVIKPVVVVINPPPFPKVVAPNAFTPNGDGVNDVFRLAIEGEVISYQLKIYNRWGQEVFHTPQISRYWNGMLEGKLLPVGTYYWIFEGTDTYRGTKVTQSGSVTLLQ